LGASRETQIPRFTGHLIVNPEETQRHANIYVVVAGDIETGFMIMGYMTHSDLVSRPLRDFGYGLKYAAHVDDLRQFPLGAR
jgi:hypothetical protein